MARRQSWLQTSIFVGRRESFRKDRNQPILILRSKKTELFMGSLMDLTEAILHAKAGHSVAFLGAGFSSGAESDCGKLPIGAELGSSMAIELGLPTDTPLQQISQIYEDEKGERALKEFIVNRFAVKIIKKGHQAVASLPWRRVYTTNYDDFMRLLPKE